MRIIKPNSIILLKEQDLYIEGLKENKQWNIQHGAMSTGKTYLDCLYTIPLALTESKDGVVIFIGYEKMSVVRNVFGPMNRMYDINLTDKTRTLEGHPIVLSGSRRRDIDKLNFKNIAFIYGDEIGLWDKDFLKYIDELSSIHNCKVYGTLTADKDSYEIRDYILNLPSVFDVEYKSLKENHFLPEQYVERMINLKKESENQEWFSSWSDKDDR